jgi:DNA topoisomerase-1
VVIRQTKKKKKFYGCSLFPACDFTPWDEPTGQFCPECNHFLVKKTSRSLTRIVCSNSSCGYTHIQENQESAEDEEQ